MTDIMKLADDYAEQRHTQGAPAYNAVSACARAALQSAIEALQAECAEHKENAIRNARIAVSIRAERDQLQSQLNALAKQEPVAVVDANDDGYWAEILPDRNVKVGQQLFAAPKALAPLTNAQVLEGCKAVGIADSIGFIEAFELGVKYSERKHGIGGTP